MGELNIRLDDAKLLEALSEMAARHGLPVEAEVRALLSRAVQDYADRQSLILRSQEIRAMTLGDVAQTDSIELIREMHEERMRDLGY